MNNASGEMQRGRHTLNYRVFRPGTYQETTSLVVVHGNARAAGAAFRAFLPSARRAGIPIIAPRFPARPYRSYQRLAGPQGPWGAATDLEAVLADAAIRYDLRTGTVGMLGFSGGAQFAHRYAMVAPSRVQHLIVVSAGWYTYLDEAEPFPRGTSVPDDAERKPDAAAFLRIPMLVAVGDRDTKSGGHLRRSPQLDEQQGTDRITRALRWMDHLKAAATARDMRSRATFALLPDTTHSLTAAVERGGLADLAITRFSEENHG